MPKKEGKTISGKKPLKDISNKKKCLEPLKKKNSAKDEQREKDVLDRLLLVQSNITTVVHQIDELVAQAFESRTTTEEGSKDVECFIEFLSQMVSLLKPWVPRLKKAFSAVLTAKPSKTEENTADEVGSRENADPSFLISPSPLVSWHADCAPDRGRQLFLLTPLPMSKTRSPKQQNPCKSSLFAPPKMSNNDIPKTGYAKSEHGVDATERLGCQIASPSNFTRAESILVMTPHFKTSPPRSCKLLEPGSKQPRNVSKVYKPTPKVKNYCSLQESDSSGSEISRRLAMKYPELIGMNPGQKLGRKNIESSPKWLISPPKTCVLMEPPSKIGMNTGLHSVVEATPALKSTRGSTLIEITPYGRGKLPGETTLKRELWTKFEAASTTGIRFNISVLQQTGQKGFLDRLEEASCDEEIKTAEVEDLR